MFSSFSTSFRPKTTRLYFKSSWRKKLKINYFAENIRYLHVRRFFKALDSHCWLASPNGVFMSNPLGNISQFVNPLQCVTTRPKNINDTDMKLSFPLPNPFYQRCWYAFIKSKPWTCPHSLPSSKSISIHLSKPRCLSVASPLLHQPWSSPFILCSALSIIPPASKCSRFQFILYIVS